jgi:hypothetical protein
MSYIVECQIGLLGRKFLFPEWQVFEGLPPIYKQACTNFLWLGSITGGSMMHQQMQMTSVIWGGEGRLQEFGENLAVGGGIVGEIAEPDVLLGGAQMSHKATPNQFLHLGAKLFLHKYSDDDFQGTTHQHKHEKQLYFVPQNYGFRSLAYLSMFICSHSCSENEDVWPDDP